MLPWPAPRSDAASPCAIVARARLVDAARAAPAAARPRLANSGCASQARTNAAIPSRSSSRASASSWSRRGRARVGIGDARRRAQQHQRAHDVGSVDGQPKRDPGTQRVAHHVAGAAPSQRAAGQVGCLALEGVAAGSAGGIGATVAQQVDRDAAWHGSERGQERLPVGGAAGEAVEEEHGRPVPLTRTS